MSSKKSLGDTMDISMFEDTKPFTTKSGFKVLSTEKYAKDLAALYEEYFSTGNVSNFSLDAGESVKGTIVSITKDEVIVDIKQRDYAYVSVIKDKLDLSSYNVGQEVDVLILEAQEKSEWIKASITDKLKNDMYEDMRNANSKKVYEARVLALSNNGYELDISGIKVFMPGSLGGINKLLDFNSLVGQTINVMTVKNNNNYSKYKDDLIFSHREYLKTLIPSEAAKLKIGQTYTGKVTDTSKFGVFVEFSGFSGVLTGLIHRDEFDEILKNLFDENKIEAGVEIDFYLKEVVTPTRIILSRLPVEAKEKEQANKYKKGQDVTGKVTKITNFGAFVKFDKDTSGLVHISKMEGSTHKVGDKVTCEITNINNGKYDLIFK